MCYSSKLYLFIIVQSLNSLFTFCRIRICFFNYVITLTGKNFDKEGNMRNWWTDFSTKNFEKRAKCFVDFYHEYTVNGTHVSGTQSSKNLVSRKYKSALSFQFV